MNPKVSTRTCLFLPVIFLPASNPRSPGWLAVRTLWLSRIAAVGAFFFQLPCVPDLESHRGFVSNNRVLTKAGSSDSRFSSEANRWASCARLRLSLKCREFRRLCRAVDSLPDAPSWCRLFGAVMVREVPIRCRSDCLDRLPYRVSLGSTPKSTDKHLFEFIFKTASKRASSQVFP